MQVLRQSGIFFEELDLLAVSDLQLGYEYVMKKQGIDVPISQFPLIEAALGEMIDQTDPKTVLINGDLKHEFSQALQQEWDEVIALVNFLKSKNVQIVLVKGNHDNFVTRILRNQNTPMVDAFFKEGYAFIHGHKLPQQYVDYASWPAFQTLVIGHVHPAVSLRDEVGHLHKYKCALAGKFERKNLVVLPSLSPLAAGFDVMRGEAENEYVSPLLQKSGVDDLVPYVIDRDVGVKEFPKIKYL